MTSPRPQLSPSHYRVYSAFRCELSRFTQAQRERIQQAGLTPQQFSLLVLLAAARGGEINIGTAAEELHLAHNSVVGLSQRAEQAGLLTRVSAGGRRQGTTLRLTELGARRLDEITRVLITELAEDRLLLVETLSRWNTVLAARGLAPGGPGRAGASPGRLSGYAVRRAEGPDRPLVWNLLQLYLHELSPVLGAVPDERASTPTRPSTPTGRTRGISRTCSNWSVSPSVLRWSGAARTGSAPRPGMCWRSSACCGPTRVKASGPR